MQFSPLIVAIFLFCHCRAGIALSCLQPVCVYLSDFSNITDLLAANVELNAPLLRHFMRDAAAAAAAAVTAAAGGVGGSGSAQLDGCRLHGSNYSVLGYSWGDGTCQLYTPSRAHAHSPAPAEEATRSQGPAGGGGGGGGGGRMAVLESLPIDECFRSCDVAIASDVVYDPIGYAPLFKAISAFLGVNDAAAGSRDGVDRCFVMAHRHRNPEDSRLVGLLLSIFVVFMRCIEVALSLTVFFYCIYCLY
jgi:hypothetical protein